MSIKKGLVIDLVMIAIIGIVGFVYLNFIQTKQHQVQHVAITPSPTVIKLTTSPTGTTLANPASVNCTKTGGILAIKKRGDGGEYGLCQFEDNMACEEWTLYRGQCPFGGVRTTGFDSIQEKYCAWLGGQTYAVPNAQCKLPNGHICSDEDLYSGKCS